MGGCAQDLMVKGGIPGIENVGGDLDKVTGKRCFFMAFPWRWRGGEGCGVRILAVVDPDQAFRFERGRDRARCGRFPPGVPGGRRVG